MKKLKKLAIKKVTLRDLDDATTQWMAGGGLTTPATCAQSCKVCPTDTAKVGECCAIKR